MTVSINISNNHHVTADNASEMVHMGWYLDKDKSPDHDDPDGPPTLGIKMNACLALRLDKLVPSSTVSGQP